MTSTNINVGLLTDKSTSRVLKPPGGGHTDIFGPAEPEVPKRNRRFESNITLGADSTPKKTEVAEVVTKAENGNGEVKEEIEKSSENGQQNHHEEPKELKHEPVKPASQEPPRRVRVPPGGFSSGLW